MDLSALARDVAKLPPGDVLGRVSKVVGLIVESRGPEGSVGEQMAIHMPDGRQVTAEVVGFQERSVLLMPVENLEGIRPGLLVEALGHQPELPVSASLLGRVIDPLGRPLDGGPPIEVQDRVPIHGQPPNPMRRRRINEVLSTGVRSIDGLLTLGKGQRIGIFAGSGVGKSTLMGMIARNTSAQVNVIALVGERGRELKEFIDNDLGPEGLARSVVVVATSDQTPLLRLRCALSAMAIAEHFMRQGKDVLMMMDSVTRFAMAQREVGLSAGEPPSSRGYTPSVFALLPRLMERAGAFEGMGSITGIFTVLVEGDDMNEPIADAVRGILDGHVVLSRRLAAKNHFPAVDVLPSISRLFSALASPEQKQLSAKMRDLMATYDDAEDLIQIGAYTKGSSPSIDQAIQFQPAIQAFLRQAVAEGSDQAATLLAMGQIFGIDLAPFLKPAGKV
ncbi:FliI/YscN family ATPase [Mesoterricola sediminis]|uniref:Flagellar protein export ATPase FliI n=1 Tax=Mesoterricola sediminis TaxID=2927980 RepID=A0AA48GTT7_9BACT|nr:FliI/YscN family ATPase [Mesoterricola sediminis]BDU77487.1 flagellar protein export ATPase FliI [Mesoterricola sediminis]